MKSYIEPLSAAEALDVLDLYGVDTPGAFPSTEHEGCVEVEMAGHTVLLETPDSVKMLFGDDAAAALRHHASFRKDAAEIMGSALDLGDFLYNVYSGEAFIPDTVPDRLIDNFIPAMKRCDASGGGPAPGTEDAPEGATVRATRPGDINISFPALAERAQAAALATACGASAAAGNRL